MTNTAKDLENFYWDQLTASYLMTDACDSAIRRHKKHDEVFDVLCELIDPNMSGINFGNEGFSFDFDFIPANLAADVIDDLIDGKEINPYDIFSKLEAIDEFNDCENDGHSPIKTIH